MSVEPLLSSPSPSSLDAAIAELDAQLDARIDARIDALLRRATAPPGDEDVSFAVGGGEPAEADELLTLVRIARGEEDDDEALSFAAGGDDEGRLARAKRELTQLVDQVVESITSLAVVKTGQGAGGMWTRVSWTGDVITHVAPQATVAVAAVHVATVETTLTRSVLRLRLLTRITAAAGKLAAVLTTPGSAVMALPIAYRCVRDVYDQLSTLRELPKAGER